MNTVACGRGAATEDKNNTKHQIDCHSDRILRKRHERTASLPITGSKEPISHREARRRARFLIIPTQNQLRQVKVAKENVLSIDPA